MNCDAASQHLDDWLDGVLSDETRDAVDAHVETCDACRALFAGYESLTVDLATLGAIADRIADEKPSESPVALPRPGVGIRWGWGLRIAASIAIAAGAALATWSAWTAPSQRGTLVQDVDDTDGQRVVSPPGSIAPVLRFALAEDNDPLVVPVKTDNPRIHMVWLYPSIKTGEAAAATDAPDAEAPQPIQQENRT